VSRDTRSSQRYDVIIEVEIRRGDAREQATARNLSIGGMLLEMSDRLAIGEKLQVQFRVPGAKDPVEATAIVRWHDGAATGVQFDGLRARDVWALGKYFDSL
jgi:hypothetical protein